jgi:hypothetical protein
MLKLSHGITCTWSDPVALWADTEADQNKKMVRMAEIFLIDFDN